MSRLVKKKNKKKRRVSEKTLLGRLQEYLVEGDEYLFEDRSFYEKKAKKVFEILERSLPAGIFYQLKKLLLKNKTSIENLESSPIVMTSDKGKYYRNRR